MKIEPLLLDIPDRLETTRLMLRVPRAGDGVVVAASVRESLPQLKPWIPWAKDDYAEKDGEEWCRRSAANFLQRTILSYAIWLHSGEHVGSIGAFAFDWDVPRAEIGYWMHSHHARRGLMSEAVRKVADLLRDSLQVLRIEIRMDEQNIGSWRVAEKCGFTLDGTLHQDYRYPDGRLRNTRIYSQVISA
jgi:RimJ/RimL family protein N-acetyltransferase